MHNLWRFDPTTLRLFISACEEGTFGRAAEKEGLVPSALSKRMAELEEAVGTPLLYRQQKGIEPTPAGLCLLQHARHVLDEMTVMSAALSRMPKAIWATCASAPTAPASCSSCRRTFVPTVKGTPPLAWGCTSAPALR